MRRLNSAVLWASLAAPAWAHDATVTATVGPAHAATATVAAPATADPAVPEASSSTPAVGRFDVTVRAAPMRRSASEVVRDRAILNAAPHRSADELLSVVPGLFITQHSGEGKAFQIFYRGFDAVHGQDLEIWAAGAPVNDVSNIHGQGYADLHFLPVEVVKELRATPGTYDPRQGDFAVAGTLRFEVGNDHPGFTAKASVGSFGSRRLFLAFRPDDASESNFAAVEAYHTDGFGPSRSADRASAVSQWVQPIGGGVDLRLFAGTYATRFASAGVLPLQDIEQGRVGRFDTYDATQGGNSSRTQLLVALEHDGGAHKWALTSYLVLRSLRLRDNFTGFLIDPNGDSQQQLNDALVGGAHGFYRRTFAFLGPRDTIEMGFFARADWIDQSQRRLSVIDNSVTADLVNARVRAQDIAGYLDVGLTPLDALTVRGGVRVDGLAYAAEDTGGSAKGQARGSQGAHVGAKATIDLRLLKPLHAVVSYGDGFRSPQARSLADGQTTPYTQVRSGEAGLRFAGQGVRATAAGFYTTLSEDLVFDQATNRNERVPATRRLGVALDAELRVVDGLIVAASATFTEAQFTASSATYSSGSLVPYAPQLVARADATYERLFGEAWGQEVGAQVGAGLSVLARRPLPFGELGDDIALVDARALLRVGPAELGLDLYNLFDSGWYDGQFVYASRFRPSEAAGLIPQRHVTVGAPRTLIASLALHI